MYFCLRCNIVLHNIKSKYEYCYLWAWGTVLLQLPSAVISAVDHPHLGCPYSLKSYQFN
jgi:hypothetical protein